MKTKYIILLLVVFIFNSCIVKSLHPFYTKKTISSNKQFLGEWKDNEGAVWKVKSLVKEILNEKPIDSLKKDDLKAYYKYEHAYIVERTKKNEEIFFLTMPFKVDGQLFLDFIPLDYENYATNRGLLELHYVSVHSLVKYDVLSNGDIKFRWLDEDKIQALFGKKKIKIKHEKIGLFDDNYLLTAKPEELQKFIKKYMASDDTDKWKTSTEFTLTKVNEKP